MKLHKNLKNGLLKRHIPVYLKHVSAPVDATTKIILFILIILVKQYERTYYPLINNHDNQSAHPSINNQSAHCLTNQTTNGVTNHLICNYQALSDTQASIESSGANPADMQYGSDVAGEGLWKTSAWLAQDPTESRAYGFVDQVRRLPKSINRFCIMVLFAIKKKRCLVHSNAIPGSFQGEQSFNKERGSLQYVWRVCAAHVFGS